MQRPSKGFYSQPSEHFLGTPDTIEVQKIDNQWMYRLVDSYNKSPTSGFEKLTKEIWSTVKNSPIYR